MERMKQYSNKKKTLYLSGNFEHFFPPYYYLSFKSENENYTLLPLCFSAPFAQGHMPLS